MKLFKNCSLFIALFLVTTVTYADMQCFAVGLTKTDTYEVRDLCVRIPDHPVNDISGAFNMDVSAVATMEKDDKSIEKAMVSFSGGFFITANPAGSSLDFTGTNAGKISGTIERFSVACEDIKHFLVSFPRNQIVAAPMAISITGAVIKRLRVYGNQGVYFVHVPASKRSLTPTKYTY